MISALIFIAVLGVLVAVHEWGHFIVARICGVQVDEFAIGFGPKLLKWQGAKTEYSICAIPLGGYVKMAGDERDKCTGEPGEFLSAAVWKRALIVLAGPVVNFVFAYLCFIVVFMVGYVDMEKSMQNLPATVANVSLEGPAAKAGIKSNDVVKAVEGVAIANWADLQDAVMDSTKDELTMTIDREGLILSLTVRPEDKTTKNIFGRETTTRIIGVEALEIADSDFMVIEKYGLGGAITRAGEELWMVTSKTYEALFKMVTGQTSFDQTKKNMTGVVGIFFILKFAASVGFAFLMHIVGVISASLAILNLLPIVPLDGGHLFFYGIEAVRGRPLSAKADEWVTKAGFAFFIVLFVFAFYVDFEKIGLIEKIKDLLPK